MKLYKIFLLVCNEIPNIVIWSAAASQHLSSIVRWCMELFPKFGVNFDEPPLKPELILLNDNICSLYEMLLDTFEAV